MWALWFVPLIVLMFLAGVIFAVVWYFARGKDRRPKIVAVLGIPLGCAALPIAGVAVLATIGNLAQKSDAELYEEAHGYKPSITEDRMMFDDFGSDETREIFMRAEPDEAERRKLLSIPNLVESELSLDLFVARGAQHGFSWWISSNPLDSSYCKSARIVDAHGYRGWIEFSLATCLDAGNEFPASTNAGEVFVVASRRG